MKVLYIASRPPLPIVGGREYMISQSLRFLCRDNEVSLVCFYGKNDVCDKSLYDEIGLAEISFIKLPSAFQVFFNLVMSFRPFQLSLYYSRFIHRILYSLANRVSPDVIVYDMLRVFQFRIPGYPSVVDLDDLLSNRYKQLLLLSDKLSPFGTFSDRLPKILKGIFPFFGKFFLRVEARRIRKEELAAYVESDSVILTSPLEAKALNSYFNSDKAHGISQAVAASKNCGRVLKSSSDLFFIGNFTTAQNLQSAKFILQAVMPHLLKLGFSGCIRFVGKYNRDMVDLVSDVSFVKLEGFVEDLDAVADRCFCALMPISFGTGIKTKILDAMAIGLPVITNYIGAEGLPVSNQNNIVIEDQPEAIAVSVMRLYNSAAERQLIVQGAYEYLAQFHDENLLASRYCSVLESVIDR